jgi:5-hydroxyisourate hydrolase
MSAKLTTHVLDLSAGRPAAGMKVELWLHGDEPKLLLSAVTNGDGRTNEPLLDADGMAAGAYELVFFVRDYFVARNLECSFLDRVPIRFDITTSAEAYHVPLLVTPWAYSTYRGS